MNDFYKNPFKSFKSLIGFALAFSKLPYGRAKGSGPLRLPRGGEKPSGWYSPPLGEVGRGLFNPLNP